MADLVGIASIIGSSATFVGTTGGLWLMATGRMGRNGSINPGDDVGGLTDEQLQDAVDEREKRRREKHPRGGRHHRIADLVFPRRRDSRVMTP